MMSQEHRSSISSSIGKSAKEEIEYRAQRQQEDVHNFMVEGSDREHHRRGSFLKEEHFRFLKNLAQLPALQDKE